METLGSVSVIASDKTGTLTRGEMTVRRVYVAGRTLDLSGAGYEPRGEFTEAGRVIAPSGPLVTLLEAAALASDARLQRHGDGGTWSGKGDPTELALIGAAEGGIGGIYPFSDSMDKPELTDPPKFHLVRFQLRTLYGTVSSPAYRTGRRSVPNS